MPTRRRTAATLTACTVAASLTGLAPVAAHAAGGCAQANGRYVQATRATDRSGVVDVVGHPATYHCGGPDDGSYVVSRSSVRLTLRRSAVIRVLRRVDDPSKGYEQIAGSRLPGWIRRHRSEPIYHFVGSERAVQRLTEEFHP